MDKDGMRPPRWCSTTMDCGFGYYCVTNAQGQKICSKEPNKAKTPKEGE